MKKEVKKASSITCAEFLCSEEAVYKIIEDYKPVYLCKHHGEIARANGFEVVELETENA